MAIGTPNAELLRLTNEAITALKKAIEGSEGHRLLIAEINNSSLNNTNPLYTKIRSCFANYKTLTGNQNEKFQKWLLELGPFELDEDANFLVVKDVRKEPAPAPVDRTAEQKQLYSVAFLDVRVTKVLRHLSGLSQSELQNRIIKGFSRAAAGLTKLYRYAVDVDGETVHKIVYDTGIKIDGERTVYIVLQTNPNNTDGSKQPYYVQGFWYRECPGGQELYNELIKGVPQLIKAERAADDSNAEIEEAFNKVKACQTKFADQHERLTEAVENGVPLDDELFNTIAEYRSGWQKLTGWYPECETLSDVQKELDSHGDRAKVFDDAKEALKTVIGNLTVFCNNYKLFLKNMPSVIEGDLKTVDSFTRADEAFSELLQAYQNLLDVTLGNVTEELKTQVAERFQANEMVLDAISDYDNDKDRLGEHYISKEDRKTKLKNFAETLTLMNTSDEVETVSVCDADELLEKVTAGLTDETFGEVWAQVGQFYTTEFEKALVEADYEQCEALLEADAEVCAYGDKETLLAAVQRLKNGNDLLTFTEIARRLFAVIGNYKQVAEKYCIFGLAVKETQAACTQMLVNLYAEEDDSDNFLKVWENSKADIRVSPKMLKMLLAEKDEEWMRSYLQAHGCLLHVKEFVEALDEVAREKGFASVVSLLASKKDSLSNQQKPNAFEQWVVECSAGQLDSVMKEKIAEAVDYSENERADMLDALRSYHEEIQNSTPVAKLFWLEDNRNGIFEQYAWKCLADAYDAEVCLLLFRLLNKAERFSDICDLKCYETELTDKQEIRRIYFTALGKTANLDFARFARDNLQDCLTLLHVYQELKEEDVEAFAEMYSDIGDKASEAFCNSLLMFNQMLKEDETGVLRNIVTLSSSNLNGYALDASPLKALGLSDEACDRFMAVFRTQMYEGGRDAVAVAQRVQVFIGACKGYAQCFAEEALAFYGEDAVDERAALAKLLWKLFSASQNTVGKQELLKKYRSLIAGHEVEISELFFIAEMFKEFEEEVAAAQEKGVVLPNLMLQERILRCKQGEDVWNSLESLNGLTSGWVIRFAETLAEGNPLSAAKFAAKHFEEMLGLYAPQDIYAVVTGGGKLSPDKYKDVRDKSDELKIYLFEAFEIGRNRKLSEEYFAAFEKECPQLSDEEKREKIKRMNAIYAVNPRRRLQLISRQADDARENQDAVVETIKQVIFEDSVGRDELETVVGLLKNIKITSVAFYERLVELCRKEAMTEPCLELLVNVAKEAVGETLEQLAVFICELYDEAMENGSFKDVWVEEAQRFCRRLLNTDLRGKALWCLYKIQKHLENDAYYNYLLLLLFEMRDNLDETLRSAVEADMQRLTVDGDHPTRLSLFEEMAKDAGVDEITAYCVFCGELVDRTQAVEDDELTEANEKEQVLLELYKSPLSINKWKNFSETAWDEHPEIYTKILYKIMTLDFVGKDSEPHWMMCVKACRLYKQNELLLKALLATVRSVASFDQQKLMRGYLLEVAEKDAACFSVFDEEQKEELCDVLANAVKQDDGAASMEIQHSALRDLSTIVVYMNSESALKTFLDRFKDKLYSREWELNNVSLAIAVRLMQHGRFEEAKGIFTELNRLNEIETRYKKLIKKLAAKDETELEAWATEAESARLMSILLPDGNYPNIDTIIAVVLEYSSPEKAAQGAAVLYEILENKPQDPGVMSALFMLCKLLPERTDMLHKVLGGLATAERSKALNQNKAFGVKWAMLDTLLKITSGEGFDTNEADGYSDKRQIVADALQNTEHHPTTREIVKGLVFSTVTGNWRALLDYCRQNNAYDVLRRLAPSFAVVGNEEGLTRSVLQVAYALDGKERKRFLDNVKTLFNSEDWEAQANRACTLCGKWEENLPEKALLDYPLEEHSFVINTHGDLVKRAINSQNSAQSCEAIVSLLGKNNSIECFRSYAKRLFEEGDYENAYQLHTAMESSLEYMVCQQHAAMPFRIKHKSAEAMSRICGVFGEREEVVQEIGSDDFKSWRCINMLLEIVCTARANEVSKITQKLSEKNQELAKVLLTIVSRDVPDGDKKKAIESIHLSEQSPQEWSSSEWSYLEKGLLCCIALGKPVLDKQKSQKTAFVKNEDVKNAIKIMLDHCIEHSSKFWNSGTKMPIKTIVFIGDTTTVKYSQRLARHVESEAQATEDDYKQRLAEQAGAQTQATEDRSLKPDITAAEFVKKLEAEIEVLDEVSDETCEALWENRKNHPDHNKVNRELCKNICAQLYKKAKDEGVSQKRLAAYAILYGIDLYYCERIDKKYKEARSLLLEMVRFCDVTSGLEGQNRLKDTVARTGYVEVFKNGFSSLYEMVTEYKIKQDVYKKMKAMLSKKAQQDVEAAYKAFDVLYDGIAVNAEQFSDDAVGRAEEILNYGTSAYGENTVRIAVLDKINDERKKMLRRSNLKVTVYRDPLVAVKGLVYGHVTNTGLIAAKDVELTVEYFSNKEDRKLTRYYRVHKLDKDCTAAFQVPYELLPNTDNLVLEIRCRYTDQNGDVQITTAQTSVTIEESAPVRQGFSTPFDSQNAISNYELSQNNTLDSKDLYGRVDEKIKLDSVTNAANFTEYKNMLVLGIRRVGKSSLLNYLRASVNMRCDEAVAALVSCEPDGTHPIYHHFVRKVLVSLEEGETKQWIDEHEDGWNAVKADWATWSGDEDIELITLGEFYRQLKEFFGKGIILIIDEFDNLLDLMKAKNVDSQALSTLSSLLNQGWRDTIRIVVCGSSKMMRRMNTYDQTQFFAKFGEDKLVVGKLQKIDVEDMLDNGAEKVEMIFSNEAREWIWRWTGGLAWYTKLLASKTLENAFKEGRKTAYPWDVAMAIDQVGIETNLFDNVMTSLDADSHEKNVLKAMQLITAKPSEFVDHTQLKEYMETNMGLTVDANTVTKCLSDLCQIGIIEKRSHGANAYRFAVQLYWRYFKKVSYEEDAASTVKEPIKFEEEKTEETTSAANRLKDFDF